MLKKSKVKEEIDSLSGSQKRLFKKLAAKKHNEEYIPFSLDSKKFTWKKNCTKGCYGRGYIGFTLATDKYPAMPIPCRCVREILPKEEVKAPPSVPSSEPPFTAMSEKPEIIDVTPIVEETSKT
jgi:hypothetical protein